MKIGRVSIGPTYCLSNIDSSHRGERSLLAQESPGPHERTLRTQTHGDTQQGTLPHAPPLPPTSPPRQPGVARGAMRRRIVVLLQEHPEGLTPGEMRDLLGVDRSLVDTCQGMLRYRLVRRVGRGRYVAAEPSQNDRT